MLCILTGPRPLRLIVALVAGAALATAPAAAQEQDREPTQEDPRFPLAVDVEDVSTMDPDLDDIALQGDDFEDARDAYEEGLDALRAAGRRWGDLNLARQTHRDDLLRAATRTRVAGAVEAAAADRLGRLEAAISELAVAQFVGDYPYNSLDMLADPARALHRQDEDAVVRTVTAAPLRDAAALRRAKADAGLARTAAEQQRDAVAPRLAETEGASREAAADLVDGVDAQDEARRDLERERVLAEVEGTDFPLVALDAYYRAAKDHGACGIEWWALAGISRVEGRHGTFGGAELTDTGATTKPIIGIPLDGTNGTRVITDTDGGALDGDTAFDRAVGPMQFIPSTWAIVAADGNADELADPHNLYDATAAAADYLCRGRVGLGAEDRLHESYLSYNHSVPYADQVLGLATGYRDELDLTQGRSAPGGPPNEP
jgi:membrane-bound lytic murein transglycosylase B